MPNRETRVTQDLSIDGLTPFLVAITICAPLWGVTISQANVYYATYKKDSVHLKVLVAMCMILSTTQLATLAYTVYFWMIICRNPVNYAFLGALKSSLVVAPAYITYFLTTVVQCFYALRVWYISQRKIWLVVPILVLSSTQLMAGFALVGHMTASNTITAVYSHFNRVFASIELGCSMACDVLVSGSLWYYLQKSRGALLFKRTRNVLNALILQAINIGLLTSTVTLVNITTYFALPVTNFTWAIFHFSVGMLYVNSMLVSLNSRKKLQHNLGGWEAGSDVEMEWRNVDINSVQTHM